MENILITIPGATAHHVLGESNVTLGAGDLSIVPSSDAEKSLMLTVGSAAFSLHKGTPFGTLEGDSRTYVFSPEIQGVTGGFVKVTLPEGVAEDGSQLSKLQTRFEELLIEHGLLQPAASEGTHTTEHIKQAFTSEPLVTIPGTVAAQVLGEETKILSEGILSLVLLPKSDNDNEAVLTLTVGNSAFPLYKSTPFGTLDGDSRTYLFTPDIHGINKGFVAIVLPEAPAALTIDLAELQNQFELILVEHGLLKDGFEAIADELARSVREDSARTAHRIRAARDIYLATYPRTTEPTHFSPAAHTATEGGASGTQAIAKAAHRVSGVVMAGAASAGAWIASTFVPTEKGTTDQLDSAARGAGDIVGGVGAGMGEVKDAVKDAAGSMLENDYGPEARAVVGDAGQSVGNVGAAVVDVAAATSGVPIAVAALQGAAGQQKEEQQEEERRMEGND